MHGQPHIRNNLVLGFGNYWLIVIFMSVWCIWSSQFYLYLVYIPYSFRPVLPECFLLPKFC